MNKIEPGNKRGINIDPFIYNVPVRGRDFYDREKIVKKLLKETVTGKSQGNVWITGIRQVGKTSLLRFIQSEFENYDKRVLLYGCEEYFRVAFIYLNIQDIKTCQDFYHTMRQSLKDFFDFKLESKPDPLDNFIDTLSYLYKQKYYIIFLVDEFDAFIEHLAGENQNQATAFLADFNKMIQGISRIKKEPKVFSCIFSANHTIEDIMEQNGIERRGSGLIVENIELPWFTKDQVYGIAEHYLKNNSLEFSPAEIDFCYKMTRGYPYFVQKLFSLMYDQKIYDKENSNKNYLKQVKRDYGNAFKDTIKGWGGAKMPKGTLEKLKELSLAIIDSESDKIFASGIKALLSELPNII